MKKLTILLVLSLLFIYGCSNEEVQTIEEIQTIDSSNELLSKNNTKGVIHHVSVGSNDGCEEWGEPPGCDKSFSLVANMYADGSIKGQWTDLWFRGKYQGVHIEIDCMIIDGNTALVGGYVTKGMNGEIDITGMYGFTLVVDNGSSKKDPLDQISFAYGNPGLDCAFVANFPVESMPLFDINGQVKIW